MVFDNHARAQGVSVPNDLSIVVLGSGTRTHTFRSQRVFTSYAIPREEMGRQATSMLVETLTSPRPRAANTAGLRHRGRRNAWLPKSRPNLRKENLT